MQTISNSNVVEDKRPGLQDLIGTILDDLDTHPRNNKKKIIEVCHVGKFLMLLDESYKIDKLSEQPDFIISKNNNRIGLEHQILIDPKSKEIEGFYENIFDLAEIGLRDDPALPNFHATCYVKCSDEFCISDKTFLIEEVKKIVRQYLLTGRFDENPIIQRIHATRHSRKDISPNFGAWWQKRVTEKDVVNAVLRKESKIPAYISNTGLRQWLLIVIGGVNSSSLELDGDLQFELESKFDRIFLLEDFRAKLHLLK